MDADLAGCPWEAFAPATISFCEARLCAWVAEPANAFTSLSKSVVGVAILLEVFWRRGQSEQTRLGLLIGLAALAQGPMGFSLHASGTFVGEFLDVSGMFVLGGLLFCSSLARLRRWSAARTAVFFGAMQLLFMGLLAMIRPIGIFLFVLQLVGWLVSEGMSHRAGWRRRGRAGLGGMLATMLIGFAFWVADKTGVWCDPDDHLVNGHAIWHLMTSAAIWFFWLDERIGSTPLAGGTRVG